MGKRRHRGGKKNRDAKKQKAAERVDYGWMPSTNSIYQEYYKNVGIFKDDQDEKAFMSVLGIELPATVRLHTEGKFADALKNELGQQLAAGYPIELTGEMYDRVIKSGRLNTPKIITDPPKPIKWYPNENAWKCGASKFVIRKCEVMKPLHEFLMKECDDGYLTRQEEASMIPPMFLDVQPHHYVLDMCAAPGSKTSQLVEALHHKDTLNSFQPPSGLVIANDENRDRAYMLSSMMKRIPSPNLIVTNHDGRFFPYLQQMCKTGEESHGFFDRILADVPCSGDGTIRKSPDIWKRWDPHNSAELHPIQLAVAQRGINLLKVGGLMVYSTCSLNPVENEAVVAALLRGNQGALELVDTTGTLPDLIRRPGLTSWVVGRAVQDKDAAASSETTGNEKVLDGSKGMKLELYHNEEEYLAKTTDLKPDQQAAPTVWPPSAEECKVLHLERCMRIMPNDQNTSGFFVCLLRKVKENPMKIRYRSPMEPLHKILASNPEIDSKPEVEETKPPLNSSSTKERDDEYLHVNKETYDLICSDYGVEDDSVSEQLFTRIGDGQIVEKRDRRKPVEPVENTIREAKLVTFVSKSVSEILRNNGEQKLRVVGAGTCVMKRDTRKLNGNITVGYRIYQDSVKFLLSRITKRVVQLTLEDVRVLYAFCMWKPEDEELKKAATNIAVPFSLLSTTLQAFKGKYKGAVIGVLIPEEEAQYESIFGQRFATSLYFGVSSVNPMVTAEGASNMSTRMVRAGMWKDAEVVPVEKHVREWVLASITPSSPSK